MLMGRSYQAHKIRINNRLKDIEAEYLKAQAYLLSSTLKSMESDKILVLRETEPNFFTIWGNRRQHSRLASPHQDENEGSSSQGWQGGSREEISCTV